MFDDAVATHATVTQLVAVIRKVARVVPGAAEVIGRVCAVDYSQPGKPPIDWDDPVAKQDLVSDLVNDALGLLALVAGQDVEPGSRTAKQIRAVRSFLSRVKCGLRPPPLVAGPVRSSLRCGRPARRRRTTKNPVTENGSSQVTGPRAF